MDRRRHAVRRIVRELGSTIVAFSGGADSALLLKVAAEELGDRALAVTAVSASLGRRERERACSLAAQLGVSHVLVESHEIEDPRYLANDTRRCYYCKKELFALLGEEAARRGFRWVAYGANLDDAGDFRPGMEAAREAAARAPLLEAGLGKAEVRAWSRDLGLPTWDAPAKACLSSRFPFGERITVEALARVERAEEALEDLGFRQLRVRSHGDLARIELDADGLARLRSSAELGARVAAAVRGAGFRFVTVDLEGYRSGVFNPGTPGTPEGDP